MATGRKSPKTKATRKNSKRSEFFQPVTLRIPAPTLALLRAISRLVNVSPDDIVAELVDELGETFARRYAAKDRTVKGDWGPLLAALLQLPAFKEALLEAAPKRKRAAKPSKRLINVV